MRKQYLSAIASLFSLCLSAQYAADFKVFVPEKDPNSARSLHKLLQSMVGDGVVLKNYSITKASSEEAFGFFEDKKARLGMKKGLVMTTGGIASLSSKNTSPGTSNNTHANAEGRGGKLDPNTGYELLEKLLGHNKKTYDACVIELDVVPTADTLTFNYVFGSEEYDEYVGSDYNDVFAFFISGKGIKQEQNLATVPNTNLPVSVNSINGGANNYNRIQASNPTFYVSNIDGKIGLEYDGLTKLMEIRQPVVPYETYHIKLAIADVSDNAFDSGVLIEGKSIVSYEKRYNVLFDKNEKQLDNAYKNLLDALAVQYKTYGGKILLTGHTDNEGGEDYNQELSCSRANNVSAYLQSKGVDANQIVIDCKGETMPAYDNTEEEGKVLNRRVELKITGDNAIYYQKKNQEPLTGIATERSSLLQNYPNPFSGSTTIEAYLLENTKEAHIQITDLTGKTIKTIYLLERGKTSVILDAGNMAEGIYTATLFTDGALSGNIKLISNK
jgi:outer membrane protein OmpA-like peptidoglycan-associated protein